jgi:hypothetical protein
LWRTEKKKDHPIVKIETIMWLLPVVFMIHDFEEIIMFEVWIKKSAPNLQRRFPGLARRILAHMERLSTASFAFAVAGMFLLLTSVTLIAVEYDLYSVWTGVMLGFFIHLIIHGIQFVVYRSYVPVIITSVLGGIYCVVALWVMSSSGLLNWQVVGLWTLLSVVVIAVILVAMHKLAALFETYLRTRWAAK